jgi:hypothetical protein
MATQLVGLKWNDVCPTHSRLKQNAWGSAPELCDKGSLNVRSFASLPINGWLFRLSQMWFGDDVDDARSNGGMSGLSLNNSPTDAEAGGRIGREQFYDSAVRTTARRQAQTATEAMTRRIEMDCYHYGQLELPRRSLVNKPC